MCYAVSGIAAHQQFTLNQDMLDNEDNEHQTPPGGHLVNFDRSSVDTQSLSSHIVITRTRKEPISPTNSSRSSAADYEDERFERRIDFRQLVPSGSNTSIIEANEQRLVPVQPEMFSKKLECLMPPRSDLHMTTSDSAISSASQLLSEKNEPGVNHYFRMRQNWINMIVAQKSETSLLLNRFKMRNIKAGGCNAYYTPNSKDFWRDQQAAASLLAEPRCQRNSKNAHSWRK